MRAQREFSPVFALFCLALFSGVVAWAIAQAPAPAAPVAAGPPVVRAFRLDLGPAGNGDYLVIIQTADRKDATGLKVTAEGQAVTLAQNVNAAASQLESLQFNVTVADRVLDLTLEDSADDAYRTIKRIDVVPAKATSPIVLVAPPGFGTGPRATITSKPLGMPDGTMITVKTNAGVILTPDAAPSVAGHQVAVAGDCVTLVVELPPRAPAILVDNADQVFTKAGAWTQQTGPGFRNSQSLTPAGTGAKTATWTCNNLTPGALYQISATWTPQPTNATNAAYSVQYVLPGGQQELLVAKVNQAVPPGDFIDQRVAWKALATAAPATGSLTVQLSDLADGPVAADAIRVQQIGGPVGDLQIAMSDAQGQPRGVTVFLLNRSFDELNLDLQSSPTAPAGYCGVTGRGLYDPGLGYGWLAPVTTFDRGVWNPDLLLRGGHYGSEDNVFRVQLDPRDDYQVTLRFWDTFNRDGMQVFVGNDIHPSAEVSYLPAGIAMAQTIAVPSARLSPTGWLDLRFHDTWINGGGGDPFWIVNAIEIVRWPRGSAAAAPIPVTPTPELPPPSGN